MKKMATILTLALMLPCGLRAADSLEQQFRNPPDSMKPYCYWYWLNGDITKEGITKDLEAMAKVSLNGKDFDTLWMPPFVLDVTDAVKAGENKLKVLVTSTATGKPALGDVKLQTISFENQKYGAR